LEEPIIIMIQLRQFSFLLLAQNFFKPTKPHYQYGDNAMYSTLTEANWKETRTAKSV